MRKEILTFLMLTSCLCGYAQTSGQNEATGEKLLDARQLVDAYSTKPAGKSLPKPFAKKKIQAAAQSESVKYLASAWSFHSGYNFVYDGGDIFNYEVEVVYEGTNATVKNLFNFAETDESYDITGVYDESAGTITISTPSEYENATKVGFLYSFYTGVLLAGKLSQDGKLSPVEELVLEVSEDKSSITCKQNFGVALFYDDGSSEPSQFGFDVIYKNVLLKQPSAVSDLHTFQSVLKFSDEVFPEIPVEKDVVVTNFGETAADFALSCDGDGFSVSPMAGVIPALGRDTLTVTFMPSAEGEYEGIITVENEGEPLLIQMTGGCVPSPDYSAIVKNGDLKVQTGMDYPFAVVDTLENVPVAISTNIGPGVVSSSWLSVTFTVPEGKLGNLSWKGMCNSTEWYTFAGSVFADDVKIGDYTALGMDISNNMNFAPGKHTVRFQYDRYGFGGSGVDHSKTYMYVYDLDLTMETLEDNKAYIESDNIDFGNFLDDGTLQTAIKNIVLTNEGAEPLKVLGVTNSDAFVVEKIADEASTMETLTVPVTFSANAPGLYEDDVVISTTAGDFTVSCKALVREMPDFQSIVKSGEFRFETDPQNPFLVENGKAYNSTAKVKDDVYTVSKLKVYYTVPEGYFGKLSWKGNVSCTSDEYNWKDYLTIFVQQPMNGFSSVFMGDIDCGSEAFYENYPAAAVSSSGDHYIEFSYIQNGDGMYEGDDCVYISELSLELEKSEPYKVELSADEVDLGTIYEGKSSKAVVTLTNKGTNDITVTAVEGDGPFSGAAMSQGPVPYGKTVDVELYFNPMDDGQYSGTVTITTEAGDLKVTCNGTALSTDNILMLEDFEDDAANWRVFDADGDGFCWDLAWNMFGGMAEGHVHGGAECLTSVSVYQGSELEPDNYTFRAIPVSVPENGATLTWWVGSEIEENIGDHYSLLISESIEDIEAMTNVYSETLESVEWQQRTYELGTEWAGKEVYIGFRHHNCSGNDIVKIDDVVMTQKSGVADSMYDSDRVVMLQEFYNVSGMRLSSPQPGINIVRTVYDDGTVVTEKVIVE